jgi:polysaccharide pyruvyl transferase CsaB
LPDKPSAVSQRSLIIVSGYYGFDNLGDEAILEELISELKECVPADKIVVLSNNPKQTSGLYGVNAVDRWRLAELFSLLSQARLFISGGGGLLQDATSWRPVLYYAGQILASRLLGVPVFVYAQGIGPLKRATSKFVAGWALKMANHITLRDQASIAFAQTLGLKPELSADPVWSLKSSPLPQSFILPSSTAGASVSPLIGVSLRRHSLIDSEHLKVLARIFKKTFPVNAVFLMLPFQKSEDSHVLEKLVNECNKLDLNAVVLNAEEIVRPSQWLKLMESFDLLIGMRLHALLMAIKAGKPVVGVPYDPKVTYLCETAKQPLLNFQSTGLESSWLETVEGAWRERLKLAEGARQTVTAMQEKSCKNFDILARILKS